MHPQAWFCHTFQQAAPSHPCVLDLFLPSWLLSGFMVVIEVSKQTEREDHGVDTMEQGNCEKGLVTLRFAPPSDPSAWWGSEPLEMEVEMGLAFMYFVPQGPRVQLPIPGEEWEGK